MARRTQKEEDSRRNVQQERMNSNRSHYESNSRIPSERPRREEGRAIEKMIRQSNDLYERQSM
jgi:hypothetical protein